MSHWTRRMSVDRQRRRRNPRSRRARAESRRSSSPLVSSTTLSIQRSRLRPGSTTSLRSAPRRDGRTKVRSPGATDFEPGLQRHLPRRAVDAAQRRHDLLRRAGDRRRALSSRAIALAEREPLARRVPAMRRAFSAWRAASSGNQLALELVVEHVACQSLPSRCAPSAERSLTGPTAAETRSAATARPSQTCVRDGICFAVAAHLEHDLLGRFLARARHVEPARRESTRSRARRAGCR